MRFHRQGLAGLQEKPRPGRPPPYTPEQVSAVIATSVTNPRELGLPFASWTLDRLAAYLHEVKGLPMKRTRIDELLLREGLRWRAQETWVGERVDPAFAEKRGPSRRSIPRRPRAV
jgi:transposase